MALHLEEDHPSIAVIGGFDPRLLHPEWFRSHKLLGKLEAAQAAEVKVILKEVAEWSTDSLLFQATQDRLFAQAKVASAGDEVRDFVSSTLQILDETATTAMGINRTMHFDVGGAENWHKIGHALAPKALWASYLKKQPGMRTLQIEQTERGDGLPGKIVVTVQPSQKYAHGVFFDVNNEVTKKSDSPPGTRFFVEALASHWSRLQSEALAMAQAVLTGALG